MRLLASVVLLGSLACSGSTAALAPAAAEARQTGRSCAPASASCEPGRCVATIDNQCELPVTCRMRIESQCQTAGGEVGPANASTKQVTQLAKTSNVLEASTNCEGVALSTQVAALECI